MSLPAHTPSRYQGKARTCMVGSDEDWPGVPDSNSMKLAGVSPNNRHWVIIQSCKLVVVGCRQETSCY